MTLKEATLKSLQDLRKAASYLEVTDQVIRKKYYDFKDAKTPPDTVSAVLGNYIRDGDSRVKRIKGKGGRFFYYLAKDEENLNLEEFEVEVVEEEAAPTPISYTERDLHKLVSTYLNSTKVYSKTIFHEQSYNSKDNHQKWIHPDMVGISFLSLGSKASQSFLKVANRADTFKLNSYEIKKEIKTDYDLKKSYFQAVSNSSWANYGYLVAFDISESIMDEMERLNQSFGIGIIQLSAYPYESRILFPAKYRDLDFKTLDKLCKINKDFESFIEQTEKLLNASERYEKATRKELIEFCDDYFENDAEIEKYCSSKNIVLNKINAN